MEHVKFEYKVVMLHENESLIEQLEAEGETGWLLSAHIKNSDWSELIFVRPKL
jgi:hypothetical protein